MKSTNGWDRLARVALCGLLLSAATGAALAEKDSGFLSDYSKLEKETDPLGVKRRVWISPKLTGTNYGKVMLEAVSFHPPAEPSEQVSAEVLEQIRAYIDATLTKAIGDELPVVTEPGAGVIRLRMAITAAGVDKKLKPWEMIPVGMIKAGVKEAAGVRKHGIDLFVESELTDSVSQEVLAQVVREADGIVLKREKKDLTLDDAKPSIDEWGEALRQLIVKLLK